MDRIIECIYKERPFPASAIVLEYRHIKNDDSTERGGIPFSLYFIWKAPRKTKYSYCAVTISQRAIEVLKQQKEKNNVPLSQRSPISPDSLNNILKRVLAKAGIPKVRFHNLRHTFATIALWNGVDITTVSGMLGHFSAGFILDTYTHVTTVAQKEAANSMRNVMSMSISYRYQ